MVNILNLRPAVILTEKTYIGQNHQINNQKHSGAPLNLFLHFLPFNYERQKKRAQCLFSFVCSPVHSLKKVNDSFQSFTLKLNRKISPEELSSKFKFIASSKNFGTILRAKGIVQLLNGQYGQFDFSLNEYNIEKIDYNDENIISFIGVDINKKELEHFFK